MQGDEPKFPSQEIDCVEKEKAQEKNELQEQSVTLTKNAAASENCSNENKRKGAVIKEKSPKKPKKK